jgi:hypothetical protein
MFMLELKGENNDVGTILNCTYTQSETEGNKIVSVYKQKDFYCFSFFPSNNIFKKSKKISIIFFIL